MSIFKKPAPDVKTVVFTYGPRPLDEPESFTLVNPAQAVALNRLLERWKDSRDSLLESLRSSENLVAELRDQVKNERREVDAHMDRVGARLLTLGLHADFRWAKKVLEETVFDWDRFHEDFFTLEKAHNNAEGSRAVTALNLSGIYYDPEP